MVQQWKQVSVFNKAAFSKKYQLKIISGKRWAVTGAWWPCSITTGTWRRAIRRGWWGTSTATPPPGTPGIQTAARWRSSTMAKLRWARTRVKRFIDILGDVTQFQERHIDGGVSIVFPDGTTKTISPSGTENITFPDSTVVIVQPNGRRTVKMPQVKDQSAKLQTRYLIK